MVESVPEGLVPAVCYADGTDTSGNHVVRSGVNVRSGRTTVLIDITGWKNVRRLVLNTTSSGADVPGAVTGFPVLVRLTPGNFDFSSARHGRSDLMFTNPDGAPLPFEIENWDSTAGRAEVWVKVDTVHGNDSTQSISMHWGASANPSTAPLSNGAAVFDTASGFAGVWHLNGTTGSPAKDATANRYDGVPSDTAPQQTVGAIGRGQAFNGTSSLFTMPGTASGALNFPQNGTYTMSLWAYADTIDTEYHGIASKGHEQYYIQYKCEPDHTIHWEFVEYAAGTGWQFTQYPEPGRTRTWVHITGVRSGMSQYLYINGVMVNSTIWLNGFAAPRTTSDNFTIGRHPRFVTVPEYHGWSGFNGSVDEVRVERGVKNADWIKLCYMNQKLPDGLVVFK